MKTNSCIRNLLKYILVLQNNSCESSCCSDSCSKAFLGPSISFGQYNTRVISIYTRNSQIFESTFYVNGSIQTSPFFRLQEVDDDCCTLLILNNNENGQFTSTSQTVKVRLSCIAAIKCIEDINIIL